MSILRKTGITLFTALLGATAAMPVSAQETQPAFPGAEGYGRYTVGGRGGKVYHVTTLEDGTQEGTFRWACNQSGKRTIVFDVSGTIFLKSELKLRNGLVTIAGQTAPGDGICVANYPFVISAPNVIIRFMRFRLGNEALKTNPSAHEGDGLGGMDSQNIIVDHCSVSWSIDECLSVYGSKNISIQWCIASQSLVNSGHSKGAHGYGGNWGGSGASYHHNLIAHHGSRTPRLGPRPGTQSDERMDLRNNVIYNWSGEGCYGGEAMKVNIVNNYYKPGPATQTGAKGKRMAKPGIRTVDYCLDKNTLFTNYNNVAGVKPTKATGSCDSKGNPQVSLTVNSKVIIYPIDMEKNTISVDGKDVKVVWNSWKPTLHQWGRYYIEGNVNPVYSDVTADNWKYGLFSQIDTGSKVDYHNATEDELRGSTPLDFESTTTHTAEMAYEKVVRYAGASLHRDAYDEMMASDTRNGVASCIVSGIGKGFINSQDEVVYADGTTGWPALASLEPKADTDGDGMPDEWEKANGLNPEDAADGVTLREDGYTNLEHYLNSIVTEIVENGNEGGQLLSGETVFDPSAVNDLYVPQTRPADNRIFNMMGIEMKGELAPGVYVRNGKKFIIR